MKKLLFSVLIVATMALFAIFFSGCGKKDNPVLAKIEGKEILTSDLNDVFERSGISFPSYDEELKQRETILDSLIIQKILVEEAYKRHIDASEEVSRIVLASKDRFLLDILFQREIADKVKINDADLKDFYDKLENKIQVSNILFSSEDSAKMIYDSLKNGANFEDMAVRHSIDRSAQTNRGDLGFIVWGRLEPTFTIEAFKLSPGEFSQPFKTKYGWHIAKVTNREPNTERGSFENMKSDIHSTMENIQRTQLLENYRDELKKKFPVKVDAPTCEYVLHRRASLYPPQILETMPKNDFDINQLDRDEKEMVLATWDGGQITLGQYLTKLRKVNNAAKPDFDNAEKMADFVFQLNFMDILAIQARRQGLEDDSEFKNKIEKFKELAMADVMENDSIPAPAPPDEGQMRQYYEDHLDEFKVAPKARVYEIMFPTLEMAKKYRQQIKSIDGFRKLADEFTERPGKRGTGGDLGYIDEQYYPDIFRAIEPTPVGGIAGPISVSGKYSLIYVADKKAEEIKDFLMVKPNIKDAMEKELKKKAFTDWVDQKKKDYSIKIFEDNLKASINKAKYTPADTARG
jgi:peptidyl-prolyl cis-trans isomerase C